MRVLIERDYQSMSERAAWIVADLIRRKPNAVLSLPTGSTPVGMYKALVRIHQQEGLDFSRVTTFNLDEYELPAGHPQSYHHYMQEHFFQAVHIPEEQTHILDGMASNVEEECLAFEEKIRQAGGVDLQILGIGKDGHVGFNEPASSLASRSRQVALHPETLAQNGPLFEKPAEMPRKALTMGVGTILEARACLILASGEAKADVWARLIEGPVTAEVTASALQLHPWVIALADQAAAAKLRHQDYYLHAEQELAGQPLLPPWIWCPDLAARRRAVSVTK